jgi:DNA invertase Pin-like site-specific DNA recombinase
MTTTTDTLTCFEYVRVSTPKQQIDEQLNQHRQYRERHAIECVGRYGDYQKRHKAHLRQSFQSMLNDIETHKPNMILVQRLDRFGTAGPNQLGYFLELLKKHRVRLVTTIDERDCSKEDLATVIQNMIAACQSKQEQIDKAERVLTGKRAKAVLGEYIGSKYLTYGFDVICIGSNGVEKWRLVEDAWDVRVKYVLNARGEYEEVERYGNEIQTDTNGIMPNKEIRYRPAKDRSDKLYYSPSIREERVGTLRRICEMFDAGWTTHAIAQQLNGERIKPVYSDHWYAKLIDGLLENTVLMGRPSWNRKSRSNFRHLQGNQFVETEEEMREKVRLNDRADWYQPDAEICEPIIPSELFDSIQQKLRTRRESSPLRSPKSEELWFGGLWVCAETGKKLAGNVQGKHFRVNHPDHKEKRLFFSEAEHFIGEYLTRIGKRIDSLGEAVESHNLLNQLAHDEMMKELRLEFIILEIEQYLEQKLERGFNEVGGTAVILDYDDEGNWIIITQGDLLEIYCQMEAAERAKNRQHVQAKMTERDRLIVEFMAIQGKSKSLIDAYDARIARLDAEIAEATEPTDFKGWWEEVSRELELLKEQGAVSPLTAKGPRDHILLFRLPEETLLSRSVSAVAPPIPKWRLSRGWPCHC